MTGLTWLSEEFFRVEEGGALSSSFWNGWTSLEMNDLLQEKRSGARFLLERREESAGGNGGPLLEKRG